MHFVMFCSKIYIYLQFPKRLPHSLQQWTEIYYLNFLSYYQISHSVHLSHHFFCQVHSTLTSAFSSNRHLIWLSHLHLHLSRFSIREEPHLGGWPCNTSSAFSSAKNLIWLSQSLHLSHHFFLPRANRVNQPVLIIDPQFSIFIS